MWNSKLVFTVTFSIAILIFSLTANALTLSGNQVSDLQWGEEFVDLYDSSTLDIIHGNGVPFIDAYQQSTVNVYKGAGVIDWLTMHDNSTANIYSGYYRSIQLLNNSTANIYSSFETYGFIMEPDTQLNIYGRHLDYSNGRVTGRTPDGAYYNFRLQAIDLSGNTLETFPTNVTLNAVPLPAPLILFLSGLVVLARLRTSKGNLFGGSNQVQAAAI
jgi:hypothetical protein